MVAHIITEIIRKSPAIRKKIIIKTPDKAISDK